MAVSTELVQSPTLTDAEVVRRVLAGETALFEVLVRRHDGRLYRAIRAVLRNESDTEDAMQGAWLQAYLHLGALTGAAQFTTWLLRIGTNEALGRLRRHARLAPVADPPDEETTMDEHARDPEEQAAAHETVRLLERAVDELPPIYRPVFVLRDVEQLSTAETAEALGLGEEAVKVRLHRARAMLRRALSAEVGRAAPEAFQFLAPRCNRMAEWVMAEVARLAAGPGHPPR